MQSLKPETGQSVTTRKKMPPWLLCSSFRRASAFSPVPGPAKHVRAASQSNSILFTTPKLSSSHCFVSSRMESFVKHRTAFPSSD